MRCLDAGDRVSSGQCGGCAGGCQGPVRCCMFMSCTVILSRWNAGVLFVWSSVPFRNALFSRARPPPPYTCTAHYRGGPIVQLQCCVLRVGPGWCTRQCALPCGGMSQGICALQRAAIHLRFARGVAQLHVVAVNVIVCICWASL